MKKYAYVATGLGSLFFLFTLMYMYIDTHKDD